ncbi:hypothetical protein BDV98DRAFT_374179 [Pterulicium gracile]|uniref:Uncharacterized protein n=1 Tax=Pterulicium gracile TaxID=1884261 RepID=A0A5C3Q1F9_9AGAR|nr:hypothetical protein BDV98DRAFT_374179 [Pterula gracilis]
MVARVAARRALNAATTLSSASRASGRTVVRRYASSEAGEGAHGAQKSNDMPWMFAYILAPSGKEKAKHVAHAQEERIENAPKKAAESISKLEQIKEDKDAPVSGDQIKAVTGQAKVRSLIPSTGDAPNAAKSQEPDSETDGGMTDDEGTKISKSELADSFNHSSVDEPSVDGPSKTSTTTSKSSDSSEDSSDRDPSAAPTPPPKSGSTDKKGAYEGDKRGTFQGEGETGPTDMSKARAAAKDTKTPKQAHEGRDNDTEEKKKTDE